MRFDVIKEAFVESGGDGGSSRKKQLKDDHRKTQTMLSMCSIHSDVRKYELKNKHHCHRQQ